MKNRKIKTTKIFKIGILFLGISMLLWNCEKESEFETFTERKITPQKITLSQAKKDQNFINISNQFKINSYFESEFKSKSKDNFQIDFSSFYKIEKENYVSYTFLIKTGNKDNSLSENLVVEKRNDTIRGYIITYKDAFYRKKGENLYLNAKVSKSPFKEDINELLNDNNISFANKSNLTCSTTTTYTPRTCTVHGSFQQDNPACGNYGKSEWLSYSYQTCSYENTISSGEEVLDFGGGGGGGSGSGSGETVTIITCDGEETLQPKTASSDCIQVLEEEEDQIINQLTGKADCVYQKLQTNSILKKTIEKFVGKKTPVNLIINQKSNLREDDDDNSSPLVNGKTYYGGTSYNIKITLNTEQANNRPSLAVARTILHEAIHAEIYRKIKTTSGLYLDSSTNKWRLPDGSRAHFPTLFDNFNEDPNNPHHNYMANYYRTAMVDGLKEYAASIGETHSNQFYEDFVWNGLLDTKAWEKQYADPNYAASEKIRIRNVISNYEASRNNECTN